MEEIGIFDHQTVQQETPVTSRVVTTTTASDNEEDLYIKFKKLQRQIEFLQVQEDYIKDELKNLRQEYLYAQEEVKRIQSVPLVIGQFLEAVDQNYAIVGSTTGNNDT
jgi:26S proteasome regulatory subunit T3